MLSTERRTSRPAILEAARRLLTTNGSAVSIEEIAKVAGVSRQAIYLHFANRNELIVAVADEAREQVNVDHLASVLSSARTPRELIGEFVRIAAKFHAEMAKAELGMEALCRTDAELSALWAKRPVGRSTLARKVAEQLAKGDMLALPVDRAADLIWALTSASIFDLLVERRRWSVRRYEEHLAQTLTVALVGASHDKPLSREPQQRKGSKDGSHSSRGPNRSKARDRVEPSGRSRVR